jgi:hypothetical protein
MKALAKKKKESFSDKGLLERILQYNVSENALREEFEIPDSTIRKYKKSNSKKQLRASSLRLQLEALEHSFHVASELGIELNLEDLKKMTFRGRSLKKLIQSYAKSDSDLVIEVIDEVIEQEASARKSEKPLIDQFREQYTYLNDDTIQKAKDENPELLIKMVDDTSLQPTTRADIIEALAAGANPNYYSLIYSKLNDSSPYIREASALGLFEYYSENEIKYENVVSEIRSRMSVESAEGVRLTLKELIMQMS